MDPARFRPPRVNNGPLVLLVAMNLGVLGSTAFLWDVKGRDWPICTILGIALAQVILCSYAASMGPGRLAWRWPAAAFVVGGVSLMAVVLIAFRAPHLNEEFGIILTAALFTLWLAAQLPWWILRLSYHWRIARGNVRPAALDPREMQFGIRHILLWTAVVAVLCTMGKLVFPAATLQIVLEPSRPLAVFALLVAFSSLLSILPLWAALARERLAGRWVLTLTYSLVLAGLEPHVFALLFGDDAAAGILWLLNVVEMTVLLGSSLLIRAAGYRLVQLDSQSHTPTSPM